MNEPAVPHRWERWVTACGWQPRVLGFALRSTLAACAAMALAYALGLEHPHWAAMSAWASSQPLREHLQSRGLFRVGGSVVGVVFAVILVLLAQGSLWVLAIGLALWCAACAWLGNLQRGYMVYGWMLAGYSAAMVVLLQHGPVQGVWALALDRLLTVLVGVGLALAVSWFFSPRRQPGFLVGKSRQALALVLQATAQRLRGQTPEPRRDNAALLSALAEVEELLDLYAQGSRTARHTTVAIRGQQHQAMELVYWLSEQPLDEATIGPAARQALAAALDTLAQRLGETVEPSEAQYRALNAAVQHAIQACEAGAPDPRVPGPWLPAAWGAIYRLLQAVRKGLRAEQRDIAAAAGLPMPARARATLAPLPVHRDHAGAMQAGLRAGLALLLFGSVWAVTGWDLAAFGMLGLSVMLLVFSAFDNPGRTILFVLRGQLIGAALALLCQWLAWPFAQSGWQMVLMTLPFALVAGLLFAHRRTAAGGLDISMVMFILLAPHFPYERDVGHSLGMALAIVSGPALAWLLYRGIYPTGPVERMRSLGAAMVAQLPAAASRLLDADALPAAERASPAQLHHRSLRLLRWADKAQQVDLAPLAALWQALRSAQHTLAALQAWRERTIGVTPAMRRARRRAELALQRLAVWDANEQSALLHAWQQLGQDASLPAELAQQVRALAQHHLPAIAAAQQTLHLTPPRALAWPWR
jgi:uncharacterized membrane protein YccC